MRVAGGREKECRNDLRCVMYIYQIPTMKAIILYHNYVLMNFFKKERH